MIWVVLAALVAVALAVVMPPLVRRNAAPTGEATDIAVYSDQLREVDSDLERGLISSAEAEAARIEIKRRMLAAARRAEAPVATKAHASVAAATAIGLVAFSGALYLSLGRPALPGRAFDPAAARALEEQQTAQAMLSQIEAMVAKLAERLKKTPDDAMGWRMLGWSYVQLGRVAEGLEALKRAVALDPKNAALRSQYGEALVRAADGKVTPLAAKTFDEALAIDPKDPRARFYRGLALAQSGKEHEALTLWVALIREGPADAAWMPGLREQAGILARKLNVDPPTAAPQ
jgi:cytochrome c-type biogenesis protein CcmH